MSQSLSEQWAAWVDQFSRRSLGWTGSANDVALTNVVRVACPALKGRGFLVPSRNGIEEELAKGTHQLPVGIHSKDCTFPHFLNLVWQPIIKYIEALGTADKRDWSQELTVHSQALAKEMEGMVVSPTEAMPFDDWIAYIQLTIKQMLVVDVAPRHISVVVSVAAPLDLHTTRANALHLLRSSLCKKLIGTTLAKQLSLKILALVSDMLVPLMSEQSLTAELKQDLVVQLEQLHAKPATDKTFDTAGGGANG